MDRDEAIQKARTEAEEMYRTGQFLCSEAVFLVANEYLGKPVSDEVVKLASGFSVGMGLAGGVMSLGLKYGRTQTAVPTPGMFEAAKELHNHFLVRRKSTCCRVLIRKFQMGSPEHIQQCIAITGEVAADVIDILSRDHQPSIQSNSNGESNG